MDRLARAAGHVDTQFFRAMTVLRAVTLVFAVGINAARWHDFAHPVTAWVLIGVMIVWSAFVTWCYDDAGRRCSWLFLFDMGVSIALLRSTAYVETWTMLVHHDSTLTTYWVATPVLCCAIRWGVAGGVAASVVMQVADVTMRPHITSSTVGNVFLMVLAALLVGYCAQAMRLSARRRSEAERAAAVATERERLARAVHDGVLQVLAMVQRRGAEIGGETAELGRMAGEQEAALRALTQSAASAETTAGDGRDAADLAAALNGLSSQYVTVAAPGRPVLVPRETADEIVAAVQACRDNVALHVGPTEPVWVLLEEDSASVLVSVRDNGPGIGPGRLAEAEADGRMGIAKSVRGRLRDLGGEARLETGAGQGTEWELHVPRTPVASR